MPKVANRKKSSGVRILARRAEVAKLYARGYGQVEIAAKLGCSQSRVSEDLKQIVKTLAREMRAEFREARDRAMAGVLEIMREALEAWERSKEPAETEVERSESGGRGARTSSEKRSVGQVGDPRFLQVAEGCWDKFCKMHGIYEIPAEEAPTSGAALIGAVGDLLAKIDAARRGELGPVRDVTPTFAPPQLQDLQPPPAG